MNNRSRMIVIIQESENLGLRLISTNLSDYVTANPQMFSMHLSVSDFEVMLREVLKGFSLHNVITELDESESLTKETAKYALELHKESKHVLCRLVIDYTRDVVRVMN